jgi:DNA recombination protein RmuC
METWLFFLAGMAAGCALGGSVVGLYLHHKLSQAEAQRAVAEARLASSESAVSKIGETFQALADTALRSSQGAFLEAARSTLETVRAEIVGDLALRQTAVEGVVQPLAGALERLESHVRELDNARAAAYGALREELKRLAAETGALANALRAPQARGRWGEVTLRRVAELAGMVKHCDFTEQETVDSGDGRLRPDMGVRLPGGRTLAVDAKVPLSAFLEAASAADDARRREALVRHGQQVLAHVNQLAGKQYWSQFQPSPEMVVLFLPGDQFLSAALEFNPTLIEDSLNKKVLIATPTSLVSVLKGVSYGWRQQQLAENAERIRQVAAEFYERLQKLQEHYARTGQSLERAVQAYNDSVRSWDTRVLPSLRRVRELGAAGGGEPAPLERIDVPLESPREIE